MNQNQVLIISDAGRFADYLHWRFKKKKIRSVLITPQAFVQATIHCSDHTLYQQAYAVINDRHIALGSLRGVIRLTNHLKIHGLAGQQDHYTQSAQIALWLYCLQLVHNVINPLSHEMLCPGYFYLPRLYQVMSACGMQPPRWVFDSRGQQQVAGRMLAIQSFQVPYNLKETLRASHHSTVHQSHGHWVYCLHVLGAFYFYSESERHEPPVSLRGKLRVFCQAIQLDIGELLLMDCGDQWVPYAVSRQPDWDDRWLKYWPKVVDRCLRYLSRADPPKVAWPDAFIRAAHRPFCQR